MVQQGARILVLDIGSTHRNLAIPECSVIRVSVHRQGLPFSFLKIAKWKGQGSDSERIAVAAVMQILAGMGRIGMRKRTAIRKAVQFAMAFQGEGENDLELIGEGLKRQEDETAREVYEDFWNLWELANFHDGKLSLEEGKVVVLDFSEYDQKTTKMLIEMTLESPSQWQKSCRNQPPLYIVMDEFQKLNLSAESALGQILCEGRKFRLHLFLATQTLAGYDKEKQALLQQAGTKLFFRPAERECLRLAHQIYGEEYHEGEKILRGLNRGEFIACGDLCVGKNAICKAIKIGKYNG